MLRLVSKVSRAVASKGVGVSGGLKTGPAGGPVRSFASIVESLNTLNEALPHKDAVRYDKQANMKWCVQDYRSRRLF